MSDLSVRQASPWHLEVDGMLRPTTTSEGRPIHPTVEGIRNFWRWFGDSKAVDAEGRPLVVYHGTKHDFSEFQRGRWPGTINDIGSWFSTDAETASKFAGTEPQLLAHGGLVMPVYLGIQKPLYIDSAEELRALWEKHAGGDSRMRNGDAEKFREWVRSQGYDGLAMSGPDLDSSFASGVYVVPLDSTQIKSATGNRGTFDPEKSEITMSRRRTRIANAVNQTYNDDRIWPILLDESEAKAGPFDGGCLICAKAIIRAVGEGSLVRLTSELNGGQTEHYGAKVDGVIYDFQGAYTNPDAWAKQFSKNESINDRTLGCAEGYDETSDTPDDPRAEKKLAGIIEEKLSGARFSRQRQTDTPEFRRWFGDSKVVDGEGRPLVVYHGTARTGIDTFEGYRGVAAHFAFRPELASDFADSRYADAQDSGTDEEYGDGAVVYLAYIRAESIFDARDPEHLELTRTANSRICNYEGLEDNVDKIKAAGFDAYFDFESGINNPPTGIAVFDPAQIKSATGNRGTFDPADPDITMSRRRRVARRLGFDLEEAALEPCGDRCAPEHDAEEAQVMQRASVAP